MTVSASTKTQVGIGTAAPSTATTSQQFAADTYTAIGEISDLGTFGDKTEEIKFQSMTDGRVRKLPGTKDAGEFQITVGFDAFDAGQNAMRAAAADNVVRAFSIQLNDKPNATGTNTVHYFQGWVSSAESKGAVNSVNSQVFTISITSALVTVPATAGA